MKAEEVEVPKILGYLMRLHPQILKNGKPLYCPDSIKGLAYLTADISLLYKQTKSFLNSSKLNRIFS